MVDSTWMLVDEDERREEVGKGNHCVAAIALT
jgi:hypothetical protein